jgi:hypothetical protein
MATETQGATGDPVFLQSHKTHVFSVEFLINHYIGTRLAVALAMATDDREALAGQKPNGQSGADAGNGAPEQCGFGACCEKDTGTLFIRKAEILMQDEPSPII